MKHKMKNVFISHHGKDDEYVQRLKVKLKERGYILKNSSVDSTKPNRMTNEESIKRLLRLRIQWAGTFICLVGDKTHTRDFVNWEIDQANEKGKPIIGIYKHGTSMDTPLPSNLEKYHDGLVGWKMDNIIKAIENGSADSQTPNSGSRSPLYSRSTVSC